MMRRLVLALLPVAGVAWGVAVVSLAGPASATAPLPSSGAALALAAAGGVVLAAAAARLAAPTGGARRTDRRRPTIPTSRRPAAQAAEPPTVSGYWRAFDEPDWPEGEVRRERLREEEPATARR